MPISEVPAALHLSDRVRGLGSGVFARNDQRKLAYVERCQRESLPPLLDLSLGSTDLQPPKLALDAIAAALNEPTSASYCLHGATLPFRQAVAAWAQQRFSVEVDSESEVLLLVGRRPLGDPPALARSEAKFRAIVESSNDGILFLDADGVVLYRSPSYRRLSAFRDEERSVRDLVTEKIATIGENIRVRRFVRYGLGEEM